MRPKKQKQPTAPSHLKPKTKEWFISVLNDWELEPHHVRILALAASSWDRAEQARAILDKEGLTYTDRFDAPRARPEVAIERDSRLAFARLIKELGWYQDEQKRRAEGLRVMP